MKKYVKGNFRKSIFKSDKGYIIGLFKVRETNDENLKDFINKTITFTGYFHELNEDDTYIFYGSEVEHPRYGFQYNVTEYEKLKPTDKEGIIEFLSSDLFKGVGEKIASNIVGILGKDTLNKILKDKNCLLMVPNLSQKKIDHIYEVLNKYEESHQTIVRLNEIGFNMKESLIIYNKYKTNTDNIIDDNIYLILEDTEIPFIKIDEIAVNNGMKKDDKRRIKATIIYVMETLTYKNGDSYLDKEIIINNTNRYLKTNIESYFDYFDELRKENKIKIDEDNYYLTDIWNATNNIVDKIYKLSKYPEENSKKINNLLDEMEKYNELKYNEKQKEAITKALTNNILIITGGPGTGKTTIIKAITQIYRDLNKLNYEKLVEQIALLAPTGRASKRMSESTLLPASTIHRFLKWNGDNNNFIINEDNKDKSKLVIIDEVSMIDINLLDSLLKGLTDDIKLILVGDFNQLPSVGPGQILKDFINSDVIETVHLDLLYRQDKDSYITTLAYEIKDNNLSDFLQTRSDYTFLKCNSQSIKKNIKELCKSVVKKGYDYKRVQLLAPMYRGENGIDLLNKELQEVFNPKDEGKREVKYGDVIFRENDKILQLVNMPEENIYNGDIGIIKYIVLDNTSKSKKTEVYVDFDGNTVKYTPKDFYKIKHGFIISIHKSQGSEFELVILPISYSYQRMLYKKLIYTAVTRAKKKLIIIGEPDAFKKCISNDNEYLRNSKLKEKLMYKFNN